MLNDIDMLIYSRHDYTSIVQFSYLSRLMSAKPSACIVAATDTSVQRCVRCVAARKACTDTRGGRGAVAHDSRPRICLVRFAHGAADLRACQLLRCQSAALLLTPVPMRASRAQRRSSLAMRRRPSDVSLQINARLPTAPTFKTFSRAPICAGPRASCFSDHRLLHAIAAAVATRG